MAMTDKVRTIFADARSVYADALERLDRGDIRDAAEKTWCATKRATDGLLLALTGEEPRTPGQTMLGIRRLRKDDPRLKALRLRYSARQSFLHGACFCDGICELVDDITTDIQETAAYIDDAEAFARH